MKNHSLLAPIHDPELSTNNLYELFVNRSEKKSCERFLEDPELDEVLTEWKAGYLSNEALIERLEYLSHRANVEDSD